MTTAGRAKRQPSAWVGAGAVRSGASWWSSAGPLRAAQILWRTLPAASGVVAMRAWDGMGGFKTGANMGVKRA